MLSLVPIRVYSVPLCLKHDASSNLVRSLLFCKAAHRVALMQRERFRRLVPRHAGAHARRLKNDTV